MDIYLYDGNFPLLLSVNPEEIFFTDDSKAEVYNVLTGGEVTDLVTPSLKTFTIKSFWTSWQDFPYNQDFYRWYSIEEFERRIYDVRHLKKPINVIISDLGIDIEAVIERFERGYVAGSDDLEYQIDFREFKRNEPKFIQNIDKQIYKEQPDRPPAQSGEVSVGSTVVVNGVLHGDSYGNAPGMTETNAIRQVNFINPQGSHPYHVATFEGGWRGWVSKEAVRVV